MRRMTIDWDDVRVMLASATGLGVQFAEIELVVKIAVGLASLVYIVVKTVRLIQNRKDDA